MTKPSKAKITITRPVEGNMDVLTRDALSFIATLEVRYGAERRRLLAARGGWHDQFKGRKNREFLEIAEMPKLKHAAKLPHDTCIEFLTTVSKAALDAAKASCVDRVIADFEDATAPKFEALLEGQINLMAYYTQETDKAEIEADAAAEPELKPQLESEINQELLPKPKPQAESNSDPETQPDKQADSEAHKTLPELAIRPRGLHLEEAHLLVTGSPMSASFFDVGLSLFHAIKAQIGDIEGHQSTPVLPFIYLPKLESAEEAALWCNIFRYTETRFGLEHGSIRAGIYVETLAGLLQLEGIVAALVPYIAGLTTGKWDFVFSWALSMQHEDGFSLPDRADINDTTGLMQAYSAHILAVGMKYGLPVTGGVTNAVIEADADIDPKSLALRAAEAKAGFVGASVAFANLAAPVRTIFDAIEKPKRRRKPKAVDVSALFAGVEGQPTLSGVTDSLNLVLRYTNQWLDGLGSPIIDGKMVYLAAVEIARTQVWFCLNRGVSLANDAGESVVCDVAWLEAAIATVKDGYEISGQTIDLIKAALMADNCPAFFTGFAYDTLIQARG